MARICIQVQSNLAALGRTMHFDFAFTELEIVPVLEDVGRYAIRMASKHPQPTEQATVLYEVLTESLFGRLADIVGGDRSHSIAAFAKDAGFDYELRLEQESFTDGQRGPDGYPRNLAGIALNLYRGTRQAGELGKVSGQVMSMQEALSLLEAVGEDQSARKPVTQAVERVVMTNCRSSLAPIRGSDPTAPIPPFPKG
jgi:hypothetical protein